MRKKISIGQEKYKTTILLDPKTKNKNCMNDLLRYLFWRNPELSIPALKFLEITKKNGFYDADWRKFCKTAHITIGQYSSIIKKLRAAGLISKIDDVFRLSDSFEEGLKPLIKVAESWKKAK